VPFAVNELKAVRESDARLLAHQHEETVEQRLRQIELLIH
jgi:hypothetical protein